jgi:hypothetical protein
MFYILCIVSYMVFNNLNLEPYEQKLFMIWVILE